MWYGVRESWAVVKMYVEYQLRPGRPIFGIRLRVVDRDGLHLALAFLDQGEILGAPGLQAAAQVHDFRETL